MKSAEWKTYRTRFLVRAKQLSSALSFTDHLGRQHCGRKGDYLVESCDGVLSIAPRQIFEDVYVTMGDPNDPDAHRQNEADLRKPVRFEPLRIEKIKTDFRGGESTRSSVQERLQRIRKSPQPIRTPAARFSLM
jgi:hypothetical protein